MVKYTREKIETSDEQNIVTGLIISEEYCTQMIPVLSDLSLIESPHLRTIASWAIDYYKKFDKPISSQIQDVFSSNRKALDEDKADAIEDTIQYLNEKYASNEDSFATEFYIHKSKDYIESQSLLRLSEAIKGSVTQGKIEQARKLLTQFDKIERELSVGVDPFNDPKFIKRMFSMMKESVFTIPYRSLRDLVGPILPGDVMAVMASAKKNKSFVVSEFLKYALLQGQNCALFSYEMTNEIVGMRWFQNFLGESQKDMPEPIDIPIFDKDNNIDYKSMQKTGLTEEKIMDFMDAFKKYGKSGNLRLFDAHDVGRTFQDIRDAVDRITKYQGWTPRVIVVDYDALLSPSGRFVGQGYEQMTQIWKEAKNFAQDYSCVVIMPSQFNREGGLEDNYVDPLKASGSSRKFDFVSHAVQIQKSPEENKLGLCRIYAQGRHQQFDQYTPVVCTQALELGRPILDTRWIHEVGNYQDLIEGVSHELMENKVKTVRDKQKEPKSKKPKNDFDF